MKRMLLCIISIVLCTALLGCAQKDTGGTAEAPAAAPTVGEMSAERRLRIFAVANEDADFTTIEPEQLGGNFEENIVYLDLTDVNVEIGSQVYPLEEAIRDGLIAVEEIFAYARIDARNGICTEMYTSKHCLACFTYRYPEFDLRMTYDVYETPDGKQHLINDMGIYKVGSQVSTSYTDDETGHYITREDWGLTFEVMEANSTSAVLCYTKTEGQELGQLQVTIWDFYTADYAYVSRLPGINEEAQWQPKVNLQNGAIQQITIDWTDTYGKLDKGDYILRLRIRDIFDESQVHPLMEDFHDIQVYDIPVTIP